MSLNIKKRCIMIFPQFINIEIIDAIREKFDPLSSNVKPHITLVFPFESNISKIDLQNAIISCLEGLRCFDLRLEKIIKIDNNLGMYLFLGVKDGTENIKELQNKLYNGILKDYKPKWLKEGEFMPHMTIGSFTDKTDLNNAYEGVCSIKDSFYTLVEKVSVEIIDENEDSIIEIEVNLGK